MAYLRIGLEWGPQMDVSSKEFFIDRRLEELAEKMVNGTATPAEIAEYHTLSKKRSQLMTPMSHPRFVEFA